MQKETDRYEKRKHPTEEFIAPFEVINILIVEDNKTVYKFLEKVLKRNLSPVSITHVETSGDAFKAVENKRFNLIIVDLTLDMPGDDVISSLRECNVDCPIILAAVSELRISYEQIISIGADAIVYKPIDISYLMDVITQVIKDDEFGERGTQSKFHKIPTEFLHNKKPSQ
jgi:DNA-binding response OmpR family regulator